MLGRQTRGTRHAPVRIIRCGRTYPVAVLRGSSDANVRFSELRGLLSRLGFAERIKGSHHIFTREDVAEILNLQPRNSLAKP